MNDAIAEELVAALAAQDVDRLERCFAPLELVDSQHEWVSDKLRVSYRFRSFEEGAWHLVEQQAFCEVGEAGIEQMHLACSGFRPLG